MKDTKGKSGKPQGAETAPELASEKIEASAPPPKAVEKASPTKNLATAIEAAAKADLSVKNARRIRQLLEPVANGEVDEQIVTMLTQALNRDEDLKNADAAGYVRARMRK